jgi:hypothetical protein
VTRVKEFLTRKVGPLPMWAWLAIFAVGVYIYRKRQAATASSVPVSAAPTPEAGQVLAPGDSYYDPNTGTLTTAPGGSDGGGGDGSGGSGGTDPSQSIDDLANAIAAAIAAGEQGGQSNTDPGGSGGTTSTTPAAKRMSNITKAMVKAGDIAAPFGSKRPAGAPKGYKIKGIGKGNWIYVPITSVKNKIKGKPGSKQSGNATKNTKPGTKGRPRSTASVHDKSGKAVGAGIIGRNVGRSRPVATLAGNTRAPQRGKSAVRAALKPSPGARQRPTTKVVSKPTVTQHQVSSAQPTRRPAPTPAPPKPAPKPPVRKVAPPPKKKK